MDIEDDNGDNNQQSVIDDAEEESFDLGILLVTLATRYLVNEVLPWTCHRRILIQMVRGILTQCIGKDSQMQDTWSKWA